MNYVVWALIILLLIVRNDFWNWDDPTLVFGFLPVGLLYHAGVSVAAAVLWYLATIFCWPKGVEDVEPVKGEEAPA